MENKLFFEKPEEIIAEQTNSCDTVTAKCCECGYIFTIGKDDIAGDEGRYYTACPCCRFGMMVSDNTAKEILGI